MSWTLSAKKMLDAVAMLLAVESVLERKRKVLKGYEAIHLVAITYYLNMFYDKARGRLLWGSE